MLLKLISPAFDENFILDLLNKLIYSVKINFELPSVYVGTKHDFLIKCSTLTWTILVDFTKSKFPIYILDYK